MRSTQIFATTWRYVALWLLPALLVGCDVGDECSPIECASGVWVRAAPSGAWKSGEYSLEVTHDDEKASCSFMLPYEIPTATRTVFVDCGDAVRVAFNATSSCTDCTIDDPFEMDLFLDSLPTKLGVHLERDGEVALDDERDVEYEDFYPRGPECGGGCTQAHISLVVDDDG